MSVLEKVSSPSDLKKLGKAELRLLCSEIRERIIQVVSKNGGHLGASLGAVELTVALHLAFDSPKDKIIWDVGHQCYAHKILTGRNALFDSLRLTDGIAGFPKRSESAHDVWETGHASTSISAALGFAKARDLLGQDYHVVAVIGDGSLTGGLAYEGLNNAGLEGTRLLVVLNDNSMAISRNVGAIASYLARIRTDPRYFRTRSRVVNMLKRYPGIGDWLVEVGSRLKGSLKYLLNVGVLFEELGFVYLGPIDGHDIDEMVSVFLRCKGMEGPVLVHVVTEKGKGYAPAELRPEEYHGTGPFDVETGCAVRGGDRPTYSQVFGEALCELAREDKRIVAITAAMKEGTGLDRFAQEFPDRFFDVGIAESHAVAFAGALALAGLKPVVAIYSTFLQRAYDQVSHDVCRQNAPVVFAIDRAGIVGGDGDTHQGVFDISFLRHIPGLVLMAPRDRKRLRDMLYTALRLERPAAVRYPRGEATGEPSQGFDLLQVGKGELLREGEDVVLMGVGTMVEVCLEAARLLEAQGIRAAVFDPMFLNPLDELQIVRLARSTGALVTVEEHVLKGGFGSSVAEIVSQEVPGCLMRCLGISSGFVPHGDRRDWLVRLGLTPEMVATCARQLLSRKGAGGVR
ncbi:MAG: 1-deoxy-D-xylulose-5-phosphate synthase [Bacillota bacterium]